MPSPGIEPLFLSRHGRGPYSNQSTFTYLVKCVFWKVGLLIIKLFVVFYSFSYYRFIQYVRIFSRSPYSLIYSVSPRNIRYQFSYPCKSYGMAHEKPARRLVEQRGRRSRTVHRKLNKCKCKVLTGWRRCWKWSPCMSMHFCARCSILSYSDATQRCQFSELTPLSCIACMTICCSVYKSAAYCQGDHFQHFL